MPIENRNPEPGTVLSARYKQEDRTCEVVQTNDGLRYRLDDGTEHKSPSSAGKAVTGGSCNGWVFWSIAGDEKPRRQRAVKTEKQAAAKKPAKAKSATKKSGGKAKRAKKGKAHRAAATSDASFGCGECAESFPTITAATEHAVTHTS